MPEAEVEVVKTVPVDFSTFLYRDSGSVNVPAPIRKQLLDGVAEKKVEIRVKALVFIVRKKKPSAGAPTAPPTNAVPAPAATSTPPPPSPPVSPVN